VSLLASTTVTSAIRNTSIHFSSPWSHYSGGEADKTLGCKRPGTGDAKKTAIESGRIALNAGLKAIDTAAGYENEEETGVCINESGIDRKDIYLTTKSEPRPSIWTVGEKHRKSRRAELSFFAQSLPSREIPTTPVSSSKTSATRSRNKSRNLVPNLSVRYVALSSPVLTIRPDLAFT
jgi:hypothetical protein